MVVVLGDGVVVVIIKQSTRAALDNNNNRIERVRKTDKNKKINKK